MTDIEPRNIVEAYALASKASALRPETRQQAYDKVIAFCENDGSCSLEDSIKRNMLLYWAYDNIAQSKVNGKKYAEALKVWHKAKMLPKTPEIRIQLGQKMLDAADRCHLSIPEKACEIIEISRYLQEAYAETGDIENCRRMDRLLEVAVHLLQPSGMKN